MYSVHYNKMYRTVCHVPPGDPATCSLKACLASKELSERNKVDFICSHIEDVVKFVATAPQEELSTDECRFCFINPTLSTFEHCQDSLGSCAVRRGPWAASEGNLKRVWAACWVQDQQVLVHHQVKGECYMPAWLAACVHWQGSLLWTKVIKWCFILQPLYLSAVNCSHIHYNIDLEIVSKLKYYPH